MAQTKIVRANILHFPVATITPEEDYEYWSDGGLAIQEERIVACGHFSEVQARYPLSDIINRCEHWLVAGLIDSHVHFPQTEMIARYGKQLLMWLEDYTFPTEKKFQSPDYATNMADIFLNQLLANGTTSALVYSSVHKHAADALFQAASKRNMAMVAGKVCMDRHCPPELSDSATAAYDDNLALIQQWHGNGRNYCALTPRFAPTSSPEQMQALQSLAHQFNDVFIQTHLSENVHEIEWVKTLYPDRKSYLDVYDHYDLVRPRAVFGHGIHLEHEEWRRLEQAGATIAFCPSSNLFLGSGLFNYKLARATNNNVVTMFSSPLTKTERYPKTITFLLGSRNFRERTLGNPLLGDGRRRCCARHAA